MQAERYPTESALLTAAAGGDPEAVRSLVDFLHRSRTGRESRSLWFAHASRLMQRRDPATWPAMEQSGDDVLATYARAERILAQRR